MITVSYSNIWWGSYTLYHYCLVMNHNLRVNRKQLWNSAIGGELKLRQRNHNYTSLSFSKWTQLNIYGFHMDIAVRRGLSL